MIGFFSRKESDKQGVVPFNRGSRSLSYRRCSIYPLLVVLRLRAMAYAKSWTDKYNDGWYLSLKLHERGLWDQLFTYAKLVGDTGRITGRSWSAWGELWGCDARTCRKIVTKMHDDCKVVLTEHANFLELEIVNYEYYQRVKKVEDNKSQAKMLQKCSLKQTRPDQTRPEQSIPKDKPSAPTISKEKEPDNIPYSEIVSDLNEVLGTNYREKTEETRQGIRRWWKQGFQLEDFKAVHRIKKEEWEGTEQAIYLRPSTLYGPKFENYLNQGLASPRKLEPGDKGYVP